MNEHQETMEHWKQQTHVHRVLDKAMSSGQQGGAASSHVLPEAKLGKRVQHLSGSVF